MEFVKKNLILIIVLAISLVISGVLLVTVLARYDKMNKMLVNVDQLKKKIQNLNTSKPAPVAENLTRINSDIDMMDTKVDRIHKIFGKHYRNPLQNFASIFLQIPDKQKAERELLEKWSKFWKSEARRDISPQILLAKFLNSFNEDAEKKKKPSKTMFEGGGGIFGGKSAEKNVDKTKKEETEGGEKAQTEEGTQQGKEGDGQAEETSPLEPKKEVMSFAQRLNKAYQAFQDTLSSESAEPYNKHTIHDILLDALGVPRKSMSSGDCKAFMYVMQENLAKRIKDAKIRISEGNLKFTFGDYFGRKMPLQEDIPIIITHWKLLEDLVYRFIKSGIPQVNGISKESYLGTKSNGFLYLTYKITVSGELDQIRSLVNILQEGYKEHRIYVIKELQLSKSSDEVKKISDRERENASLRRRFRDLGARGGDITTEDIDKEELEELKETIGRPIIGISKECEAVITFEYVIYVGDQL